MNEDIVIPIAGMIMVVALTIGLPLVIAYIKREGKKAVTPPLPADAIARLERMEQAIDAIAVEVERISEGQRFTTKLLSERVGAEKKLNG
jgi:hypothetical protein